ncbi:MAG: CHAT domain-containing protein [Oscillatoria princeps RMCB-10]|nr:CHAT domain-containing protein [Oscillatoria princeps RMCB-10]
MAQWKQINKQALELYGEGKFEKAVILAEQALELALSLYMDDHPNVASSLNNLAALYNSQGRNEKAEPLYEEALAMIERLFKSDHPHVASILNNLAELYRSQGRYEKAEPLYEKALAMIKRLFKSDHPHVASSLNNLAELYDSQGRYEKAEPLYEDALAMRKRLFKGDHSHVATSLNNLAELYRYQGRYEKAEPLYEDALAMRKRLFKGDQPDVATSLNNLAALYRSQGLYEKAEPLYEDALAMRKRLFKGDHPDVASSLNNLAALYRSQGRKEKAEPLYEDALAMFKRLFKGDQPDVATSLNNLAALYRSQGRYEKAEPLYEDALAMRKRLFKGDHPHVATSLNNLAALYDSQGRYEKAEPLYEDALAMIKRLFKGDHPDVASSLNNLAGLLAETNRPAEALARMKQAAEVEDKMIRRVFSFSSESDRLAYLETIKGNYWGLLSLVWKYLHNSPEAVRTALDVVLKRKALTASAWAALSEALFSGRYPHLAEEFQKWRSLNTEIVHLTYSPPLPDPSLTWEQLNAEKAAHRHRLSELQKESDNLEKLLASQVPEIQLQEQPTDRRAVALELPEGSALVEFVRFDVFDFTAPKGDKWQPARYLAFVLPSQQPDSVEMIDLGEAEPIDRLIKVFREASVKPSGNSLEMTPKKNASQNKPANGTELRDLICQPIRDIIGEHRHWLIAPDGALNLLPFQILPIDGTGKRLLMDEYTLTYLSVGRDILRSKVQPNRPASAPLIIADPDFNLVLESRNQSDHGGSPLQLGNAATLEPKSLSGVAELLSTLDGIFFTPAPGTGYLGESVAKKLGVKPYLQQEALESHLTSGKCPRILLIATHGYFAPKKESWKLIVDLLNCPSGEERDILEKNQALVDEELLALMEKVATWQAENGEQDAANWLRNFAPQVREMMEKPQDTPHPPLKKGGRLTPPFSGGAEGDIFDRLSASKVENPMMRSGVALAGANTWAFGGELPKEAGKGIVFAQDVTAIDLWANELTILSACETGIGDIKTGEGVFGLRRAFALAGSKTLVMSLWSVPDKATALLMDRFINNLQRGLGRGDALQDAQNYIRTITVGDLRKSKAGRQVLIELQEYGKLSQEVVANQPDFTPLAHPFYWGAWICQGDTTGFELGID